MVFLWLPKRLASMGNLSEPHQRWAKAGSCPTSLPAWAEGPCNQTSLQCVHLGVDASKLLLAWATSYSIHSSSEATTSGVQWQAWPCRASGGPATCLLLPCSSAGMMVRCSLSNSAQMVKWSLLAHTTGRSCCGEPLRSAKTSCWSQARLPLTAPATYPQSAETVSCS